MQPAGFVKTIRERCRVCYTCVRECPAKAIRIAEGQAEVLPERCIGCGNCVRVCSQQAKQVLDSRPAVEALLAGGKPAAILAPSFPTEFAECSWRGVVGMLRAMGFGIVAEVAFGADLVAEAYRKLLAGDGRRRHIATTCPAVVAFVERYQPDLLPALAPIVSPMVAMARALRRLHGDGLKVVFIGPCIAKKGEAASDNLHGEVDAVLTFVELREMLATRGITASTVEPSDFDPPAPGMGTLFPVSRGLLQAADISEDLLADRVVAADGRGSFVEALEEFESGQLRANLLEVLACRGCIMGPGCASRESLFGRRGRITAYVREGQAAFDPERWRGEMARFADLDLSRAFTSRDQRVSVPFEEEIRLILARMGKQTPSDELNCGACGYDTCHEHAVAIFKGLAESEMCLPHTIEKLHQTIEDLADSNSRLASTREALMQSEKMASMGQLAAGIAHEVNNPLGVVLMYAHLLLEEQSQDPEARLPAGRLKEDLAMIARQADRCKKIVAGLLNFARQSQLVSGPVDIAHLAAGVLKTMPPPAGVQAEVENALEDPIVELDGDQFVQVMNNLVSNAYVAMPRGGRLVVSLDGDGRTVRMRVADTGIGIPPENLHRIFEPFFTTKQIGKGTGLGLAVTYGIVKMHRGDIRVQSNADPAKGPTGTTFTVTLPRRAARNDGQGNGHRQVSRDAGDAQG